MGVLRGPADRERQTGHPPRVGPALQGPLPPVPHDAGQARRPQGRLGLPRAPGRGRGRKGARLLGQVRDRGLRHRALQRQVPRVGAALRRGLAVAHLAHRHVDRHRRRVLDALQRVHRERVVAVPPDLGRRRDLRGLQGRPLLRPLRHRVVEPRARPARARTATSPSRRSTCGSRSSARDSSDLLVWTTTPWTLPSNVGAAVGPDDRLRPRARARGRTRPRDGPGPGGRRARRRRRDRRRRAASPRSSARATNRRSRCSPSRASARSRSSPTTSSPSTTARASCTSRPRSARSTARSASARACRSSTRSTTRPASTPSSASGTRARFVKDTDPDLIDDLTARGRIVAVVDYTHSYPHCWRCDTPLIYWAKPTWFARTSAYKHGAARARTRRSTGTPSTSSTAASATGSRTTSTGRCRATATGARRSPCGAATTAARHLRRLGRRARRAVGARPHRHRSAPAVRRRRHDHVPGVRDRHRVPHRTGARRVVRLGLDAGRAVPLPVRARATTFDQRFPADFICEAIDQTRGWFYSLLAVNTLVFGQHAVPQRRVPGAHRRQGRRQDVEVARQRDRPGARARRAGRRRAALVHVLVGLAVDAEARLRRGHRRGHPPVPADAVEHLLVLRHLREHRRLDAAPRARATPAHVLDRWITSRLHRTVRTVTDALEQFDALAATQALTELVDDLSNWYVRRSRPRFWKSSDPAAHATLHQVLLTVSQLLAPFCPFVADELFRNLAGDRRVGAPRRLAELRRGRDRRRARSRDDPGPHARLARACRARRRQARRAPTAAPRDRAARPRANGSATTSRRRSRTS